MSETNLWIERYAELLGCDARPGSVAVAIDSLIAERNRAVASIPEHRKSSRNQTIREMRNTAVNCGKSSTCAVAGWFKTSDEIEEIESDNDKLNGETK